MGLKSTMNRAKGHLDYMSSGHGIQSKFRADIVQQGYGPSDLVR